MSKGSRGFRKGGSLRLDSECELGAKRRRKSVFRVKKAQEDGRVSYKGLRDRKRGLWVPMLINYYCHESSALHATHTLTLCFFSRENVWRECYDK